MCSFFVKILQIKKKWQKQFLLFDSILFKMTNSKLDCLASPANPKAGRASDVSQSWGKWIEPRSLLIPNEFSIQKFSESAQTLKGREAGQTNFQQTSFLVACYCHCFSSNFQENSYQQLARTFIGEGRQCGSSRKYMRPNTADYEWGRLCSFRG